MILEKQVTLRTTKDIESLCAAAVECSFDVDIISGNYIIDAKSIMGIFALDRSQPLTLSIHADEAQATAFLSKISCILT